MMAVTNGLRARVELSRHWQAFLCVGIFCVLAVVLYGGGSPAGHAVLWKITLGPAVVAPGQSATYQLVASKPLGSPPNGAPFVLEAYTNTPETISSTGQVRVGRNARR